MTENAFKLLSYVPIIFLFNSYWMLSNRQFFDNVINKVDLLSEQMESSHTWSTLFEMQPTTPILLISVIITAIALLKTITPKLLKKWGYVISSSTLDVDENLPDFYSALKMKDKEWFLSENKRMKDQYAYMVANESTMA